MFKYCYMVSKFFALSVFITCGIFSFSPILAKSNANTASSVTIKAHDFPKINVQDYALYYKADRKGTKVMQVDGDITGYQFGAAQIEFSGESAQYDVTIHSLGDGDGRCKYYIKVGSKIVGDTFMQSKASETIQQNTWKKVNINKGDVIQVSSNGSDTEKNAPGKGPRGYHMAHGRWSQIVLLNVGASTGIIQTPELQKVKITGSVPLPWTQIYRLNGKRIEGRGIPSQP